MTTASDNDRQIQREKVQQAVALLREQDLDCWLTFVRESIEGGDPVLPLILGHHVTWQSAFLVTRAGQTIAIVGKFDDDAVRATGAWQEVIPYVQDFAKPLRDVLARVNPRQIGVNYSTSDVKADGLSHGQYLLLLRYLADTPFAERLVSAEAVAGRLRSRKTPAELDRIRAAIRTTDEIYVAVDRFLALGMTEIEVARRMKQIARERGCGFAWDESGCPIVNTGPDSMVGHGVPQMIEIAPGHLVHIDFGVMQDDYCSDIQRMWYVPRPGETAPPPEVRRPFDAVVAAIQAAFVATRPGVPGHEIDAAARQSLIAAGFPEYQHATGHHVGRAAHDGGGLIGPRWPRYGDTPNIPVEPGNVLTLELGVYEIPPFGAVGLEEMVLVTETGAEWLSTPQRALMLVRHE